MHPSGTGAFRVETIRVNLGALRLAGTECEHFDTRSQLQKTMCVAGLFDTVQLKPILE